MDLIWVNPDHRQWFRIGHFQVVCAPTGGQFDRAGQALERCRFSWLEQFPVLRSDATFNHRPVRPKILQVFKQHQIGGVTRCYCAASLEPPVFGGAQAGESNRVGRMDAEPDGLAQHSVKVSILEQTARIVVIGDKHGAVRFQAFEHRGERREVPRDGAFAGHQPNSGPDALEGFIFGHSLMVGVNACGGVGGEFAAGQSSRVTVDAPTA